MKPIVILDFGSQFAHLIGNRIRRISAYSEIISPYISAKEIEDMNPAGIILSGGPQSVFSPNAPKPDPEIFDIDVPLLGICYGHQLIAQHFGGEIKSHHKEYGKAVFSVKSPHDPSPLFKGISEVSTVWMNHGDSVVTLPKEFQITGKTKNCPISAFERKPSHKEKKKSHVYSVQFHPEVTHTEEGMKIIENFADICGTKGTWDISEVLETLLVRIRKQVGEKNVFLFVSGGVDSSVAFALLHRALGSERVYGLFVDHGLLRKDEAKEVKNMLFEAGFTNLYVATEKDFFLKQLTGITSPEEKRKTIGNAFLKVQKKMLSSLKLNPKQWLLGQGTIYPDHIETGGTQHASKIKTHHNRVPEIEKMIQEGLVIEPIAEFYKDEVRKIGYKLGLPKKMIERHPFPGPGLGVRILCHHREDILPNAADISQKIEEDFSISSEVLPIQSVGVQGDERSYRHPVALYSLQDFYVKREELSSKILSTFSEINRVLLCLSHIQKPSHWYSILPAEITSERVELLQKADALIRALLLKESLENTVWQFPVVLLPFGTKKQTESIILRPIQSENAMTATAVLFDKNIQKKMSDTLLENIPHISAVFLDITSKPPGTIEWE